MRTPPGSCARLHLLLHNPLQLLCLSHPQIATWIPFLPSYRTGRRREVWDIHRGLQRQVIERLLLDLLRELECEVLLLHSELLALAWVNVVGRGLSAG